MRLGPATQYAARRLVSERVLGSEHPHALTDRANLADWTGQAGDAAGDNVRGVN